jgi:hypothetical protein
MFHSLHTLIPGFDLTSDNIPNSKDSNLLSKRCVDLKILVEESNTCSGEFVIYSLVELYQRS